MKCPRCHRLLIASGELAEQANRAHALIARCLELVQDAADMERTYGGALGLHRALGAQLLQAELLALEHARDMACSAGTCSIPPANDPAI